MYLSLRLQYMCEIACRESHVISHDRNGSSSCFLALYLWEYISCRQWFSSVPLTGIFGYSPCRRLHQPISWLVNVLKERFICMYMYDEVQVNAGPYVFAEVPTCMVC